MTCEDLKKIEYLFIKQYQKVINRRARQREPSQKRLIASQLKPRKGNFQSISI